MEAGIGDNQGYGFGGWARTTQIDIDNFLKESRPDTRLCTYTYIYTKEKEGVRCGIGDGAQLDENTK